ncbi:MAG: hypothetical protein UHX00_06710 [Caryophanon sp.]|nr:hypothetical protein [Caryophanon sp.]
MNQQLDDSIVQFNIKRICLSAKIMLAISVVLGIANIAASVLSVRDVPYFKGYLLVYGVMTVLNIMCLYYFHLNYSPKPQNPSGKSIHRLS